LAEIRGIDEPESTVNSAVVALENCYHAAARQHNEGESCHFHALLSIILIPGTLEELNKLLKLITDLMPAIDKIDRIDRNMEEIYQNMEGEYNRSGIASHILNFWNS